MGKHKKIICISLDTGVTMITAHDRNDQHQYKIIFTYNTNLRTIEYICIYHTDGKMVTSMADKEVGRM